MGTCCAWCQTETWQCNESSVLSGWKTSEKSLLFNYVGFFFFSLSLFPGNWGNCNCKYIASEKLMVEKKEQCIQLIIFTWSSPQPALQLLHSQGLMEEVGHRGKRSRTWRMQAWEPSELSTARDSGLAPSLAGAQFLVCKTNSRLGVPSPLLSSDSH